MIHYSIHFISIDVDISIFRNDVNIVHIMLSSVVLPVIYRVVTIVVIILKNHINSGS